MMNTQFADITATGQVIIYMDDILIAMQDDLKKHRELVYKVLERLAKLDLYLKPSKCQFEVRKIEFLGIILEGGTVTMDPIKVAGVQDWKTPKNVKDFCSFLGFCNFYWRFIRGFSQIAKSLNERLKKGVKWAWEDKKEKAFQELKKCICEDSVLMQPDQKKPFEVKVDASNYAIGVVLMQRDDKNAVHPVAFFFKTMNDAQRNYNVYNCELLALIEMFRHWRHYLHQVAHKVKVHTNHANLTYWKNPGDHNRRVARWHAELMEYNFELVHISGKKNGWADTLSRRPDYDQGNDNIKNLVVLPSMFFKTEYAKLMIEKKQKGHTSSARIAGSEEANPNNEKEWRCSRAEVGSEEHQSLQDLVEEDQQKNQESKERMKK